MAIIKKSEFAKMSAAELETKLFEIRRELNTEEGLAASGGRSQNPGKIRAMRRTVAKILTALPHKKDQGAKKAEVKPSPSPKADEKKAKTEVK